MMGASQAPLPTEEQQEKLLDEAMSVVKMQSFQMKCCLDKSKLMEALKHASNMLGELRTSLLSPKQYYELYMTVTDHLRHMEMYLIDEFQRGRKMADLYELVQYAGNIIPRLYLLVTVGLVYMKTVPGCRKEILRDLVEMCRGVQHPLRGLFLRNYLLQSCRNVLPDVESEEAAVGGDGTEKESHSGSVQDSIDFILLNFAEMNKLWVRMQHQGHSRELARREKERMELRLLVGTNLVRLSQLETVNLPRYQAVVLPGILEQVVSCRDAIAQEYLMESLIQVFPDEFHLATLDPFLNSCAQLSPSVNVKTIIIALIDRLAASKDIPLPEDLFDIFSKQIANIINTRAEVGPEDVIAMQGSLINFALKKISSEEGRRNASIDAVLERTSDSLKDKTAGKIHLKTALGKELFKFLKLPICCTNIPSSNSNLQLSGLGSLKMSLKLLHFKEFLRQVCDSELQRAVVLVLLNAALEENPAEGNPDADQDQLKLTPEDVDSFFSVMCDPLVNGPPMAVDPSQELDEDFVDEQILLGRFIHYVFSSSTLSVWDDLDAQYLLLSSLKKILGAGGPVRVRYTFPPLVFQALRISLAYSQPETRSLDAKWDKKCTKIFSFVHSLISTLVKENGQCAHMCLLLFLESALNASKTGVENDETFAYEFVSSALALYEEEISDSKTQLSCLQSIVGTIQDINFKSEDNLNPLRSQCCLNGAKLVKKSDQVRAILTAGLLFIDKDKSDSKCISSDGIKCIKRSIKTAMSVLDSELQLQLLVEILSHLTLLTGCAKSTPEVVDITKQVSDKIEELKLETRLNELFSKSYDNSVTYLKQKGLLN